MKITRKSIVSGIERTMDIPLTDDNLMKLNQGMHIQRACPNLSDSQREFILTGITDDEWDEVMKDDED